MSAVLSALLAARDEMLTRGRQLAATSQGGPLPDMPQIVVTVVDVPGLFATEPSARLAAEQIARMGRATNVVVELVVDGWTLADFGGSVLLRHCAGDPSVRVRVSR